MALRWIDRRMVLRGMGGIAVGLPVMEAMGLGVRKAEAQANLRPARFMLSWLGTSLSGDGERTNVVVPTQMGPGYERTIGLAGLFDQGVNGDVMVVSGLKFAPIGTSFHYATIQAQLCGKNAGESEAPREPTADQLVADVIADKNQIRLLPYRLQMGYEPGHNGLNGQQSFKKGSSPGRTSGVTPAVSRKAAYDALFTGFMPPAVAGSPTPMVDQEAVKRLRRRSAALDFVGGQVSTLRGKVGAADKARLDEHLNAIRELEKRLAGTGTPAANSAPAMGCRALDQLALTEAAPPAGTYTYNNEKERGDIFADLIAMAFRCDRTRVIPYMLTEWKCYLNSAAFVPGRQDDVHALTHSKVKALQVGQSVNFFVEQWAKVVAKCKMVMEGDQPLLNRCAFVMIMEGGFVPKQSAHITDGMMVLVAGRAGGLKAGQHIQAVGQHPGAVVLTAMRAVGYNTGPLGDITQPVATIVG